MSDDPPSPTMTRRFAVQGRGDLEAARLGHAIEQMPHNKAYRYAKERQGGDSDGRLLARFRARFAWYRAGWRGHPRQAIEQRLHHEAFREAGFPPLCVDLELAAACDLACPFCYRQWIATPDTLMRDDLITRLIEQCAELGVPSMKLNWRGEPLLHPGLPRAIDEAKRAGVLETLVNTNAVTLDEAKSAALIDAGLDVLIYSFDGGTKQTYERMRVGRFGRNQFEPVYENIRRFARLRRARGAVFPRTQIQMILTDETFHEQDAFFNLFSDCVDDVMVKAYTERGGSFPDLDGPAQRVLEEALRDMRLPPSSPYWRDRSGTLYVSRGRLPCEQPYQRMLVTYDGRVSMCCYDWGNEYPIGYVDAQAFETGDREYARVMEKAQQGAAGFQLLSHVTMPRRYVEPPKQVQTLREVWHGALVNHVRQLHVEDRLEDVPICRQCPFKETYQWVNITPRHDAAAA